MFSIYITITFLYQQMEKDDLQFSIYSVWVQKMQMLVYTLIDKYFQGKIISS